MWNFSKAATKSSKFECWNLPNESLDEEKHIKHELRVGVGYEFETIWIKIKNIRAWLLWKRVPRISWFVAVSNKDFFIHLLVQFIDPNYENQLETGWGVPLISPPRSKEGFKRKKCLYTIYGERTSIYGKSIFIYGKRTSIYGELYTIFGWSLLRLKGDGHKCSKSFRDIVPPSRSEFIRGFVFFIRNSKFSPRPESC